jgi:hypothetical protein
MMRTVDYLGSHLSLANGVVLFIANGNFLDFDFHNMALNEGCNNRFDWMCNSTRHVSIISIFSGSIHSFS